MKKITAIVASGKNRGLTLTPHWYEESYFLVCKGGNTLECAKKVHNESELETWVRAGYGIRMSGPGHSPSIVSPKSLKIAPTNSQAEPISASTPMPTGKVNDDIASRVAPKGKFVGTDLFVRFAPVLRAEQAPVVRDQRLLIDSMDDVAIYYAPFEYINPEARIVLVGITPGPTQMVNANTEARRALLVGKTNEEAIRMAKETGAFSGEPMRSNLVKQLNHWGFQKWLGLDSCEQLFSTASNLVQTTSLLRYPVFVDGDDYRGTPDMTKQPLLRKYLLSYFAREVREMKSALFLPLGPQVQKILQSLVTEGVLHGERIVHGLLHPSGNCTYRINYLIGERQEPVPHATNPAPYDRGRQAFGERFLGL